MTQKIVIGLVGESGSGKDTVADYLKHKYDAALFRFSDPIKETLRIFFDRPTREDQAWLAVEFKKRFGKNIFCKALARKLDASDLVSFNGLRYMEDYDFLQTYETQYLIYVTANQKLRWQRTLKRGEKADDSMGYEYFRDLEASLETERDIPKIGKKADFTITNELSMENLFDQVDDAMGNIFAEHGR